ncbi:AAA family ATPase [Lujinxingia vulgaris]|uniref:AAA family ATPase n=1 Tax=Lujinxingia vulgaris TaxID=2600176 RepID=A0A5C6XS08_9DELT|nr:AAA family ATPase [Lujinxingia vulgaris]TXD42637.1 AAA family ATPase [Lujinxingia vulgaris]
MSFASPIKQLRIAGFKSIQLMDDLNLRSINILIGANGAGKSNLVSFFHMLTEMMEGRLQSWTRKQGSADRIVTFGVKETAHIFASVRFDRNGYDFTLAPTVDGGFVIQEEKTFFDGNLGPIKKSLGSGHNEVWLPKHYKKLSEQQNIVTHCYESISNWKIFHFHDTSDTAGVKRLGSLHDNEYLRPDASNLAAFLYRLKHEHEATYEQIRKTVSLAIPFFDDFVLKPQALPTEEEQIRLLWRQKDSDYPFWPSQLSDGSIRFICLATALLQPEPPSTIIIDEPELGLHPYAITLLGSLIRSASKRMQLIVSTQSVPLVNEFSIEDLIIVERENGASVFRRHDEKDFELWLEEYTVGELWEKNVLGGRPGPNKKAGQ